MRRRSRRGEGRAALARLIGKLEAAAALADSARRQGGEAQRSERHRAARRAHLCLRRAGREIRERRTNLPACIAHEIGHVAHRDGTRSILQSAGLSFLFGMLLGDFVGGSAVVIGARAVLQSSYSRDVEAAADRYGVELMGRAGGDPRALGAMLDRIAGAIHPGMEILSDHPDTQARVAVINSPARRRQRAATVAGAVRMARAEAYLHGPVRRAYLARRIQADPTSRLAIWARRVAGFSVAVVLLAIMIVRAGILEIIPSLAAVRRRASSSP